MTDLALHFDELTGPVAARLAPPGMRVLALWPSPVRPDACFEAAGFTEFEDGDEAWEQEVHGVLGALLQELAAHGTPRHLSGPRLRKRGWRERLFMRAEDPGPAEPLEALWAAMQWDNLPEARVTFGDSGVQVRAGAGHVLLWLILPETELERLVQTVLPKLAPGKPLVRTHLEWDHLAPRDSPRP